MSRGTVTGLKVAQRPSKALDRPLQMPYTVFMRLRDFEVFHNTVENSKILKSQKLKKLNF